MYNFLLILCCSALLSACFEANYKIEDLYGKWYSEALGFSFNEDGTCDVIIDGNKYPGKTEFRAVSIGNTLEFTKDGKVFLSNVTIKSLEGDVLEIEMRDMFSTKILSSEIHQLKRVQ